MKRYLLHENTRCVIFPYRNGELVQWKEITSEAPKTARYFEACRRVLAQRERGKFVGPYWYGYSRNQALEIISSSKILTADLNPSASYCFDANGTACFPGGAAGGYGIVVPDQDYLYLLGLLNSRLVDFHLKSISTNYRGGWFGYDAKVLRRLPIRRINFSDRADKARHDRMVGLVERMLALHKRKAEAKSENQRAQLEREINVTDEQIDGLAYELYGLTEEEVRVVEGK